MGVNSQLRNSYPDSVFTACVGIGRDLSVWPRRVGAHSRARRGTCARVCAGENCAGTGGQGARLCAPTWEYQHTLRIPRPSTSSFPAAAEIYAALRQRCQPRQEPLDSGFRRNDGLRALRPLRGCVTIAFCGLGGWQSGIPLGRVGGRPHPNPLPGERGCLF